MPPSKEYLGQEIENVVNACNIIKQRLLKNKNYQISVDEIKEYNKWILENIPLDQTVVPGQIRCYEVGVWRYKGAPHKDCEYLLKRL